VTLALEGASRRLRRAMNKNFSEEAFLEAVERISRLQFGTLKLYMITGWPEEGEEDWDEFGEFMDCVDTARKAGQGGRKKGVELVSLSVSCLVPKPWTPLQWADTPDENQLKAAMRRFKAVVGRFKGRRVAGENPGQARVLMFLSRGGEEIYPCLERAPRSSARGHAGVGSLVHDVLHRHADRHGFPWERWTSACRGSSSTRCGVKYRRAGHPPMSRNRLRRVRALRDGRLTLTASRR
jgi:hypothetical protein